MGGDRIKIKDKEVIAEKIASEEDSLVKLRLVLLNLVGNYKMRVEEASEAIGVSKRTAHA